MRKKLAILLASLMILSPILVFADSENTLSTSVASVLGKTVFMQEGWGGQLHNLKNNSADTKEIEYFAASPTLIIKPKNGILKNKDTFNLELENAEWFFRHSVGGTLQTTTAIDDAMKAFIVKNGRLRLTTATTAVLELSPSAIGISSNTFNELATLYVDGTKLLALANSEGLTVGGTDKIELSAATLANVAAIFITASVTIPTANKDFDTAKMLTDVYALPNIVAGKFKGTAVNEISTYDVSKGLYLPISKSYLYMQGTDIAYAMEISAANSSVATVYMNKDFTTTDMVEFPLISRSKSEGDVRVAIAELSQTVISPMRKQYALTTKGATSTTIPERVDSKYNFPIEHLVIQERVANSIKKGYIILKAPYGFSFADPTKKTDNSEYPIAYGDSSLQFAGNATKIINVTGACGTFIEYAKDSAGKILPDELVIDLTAAGLDVKSTSQINGTLSIGGITLLASDYAPDGDVNLVIKSAPKPNDAGVTEEKVLVGKKNNWSVVLTRLTAVTELVSGRFAVGTSSSEFDNDHKTARVKLEEKVSASWWSLRESEFVLSEGAKFRKVVIEKEENFNHRTTGFAGLNGEYLPTGTKTQYVSLAGNKMIITDLDIVRDKMSSFEMDIWASVEAGFEGDVVLSTAGNDVFKEVTPIVIATAVAPITVTSTVTDLKIGYQWQKISDFTITEKKPGFLKNKREVSIYVDDGISSDDNIYIAPEFEVKLNEDSKMQISKPTVTNGVINFFIERNTHDKAATLQFLGVTVKVDRTVPESNNRPYKLVVAGTAIADNYQKTINSYEPYFGVKGIGVDYMNIITSAENNENILTNLVKVTIGDDKIYVGRDQEKILQMDTAAYISPESNSTMVPVRFVLSALGIADEQIKWDNEARTVTILDKSRIIQFKLDSSEININGVTSTMYSLDTPPKKVKAEVKDDRSFLPFRALGSALNVPVAWDDVTKTAIYNADLNAIKEAEDKAKEEDTKTETKQEETKDNATSIKTEAEPKK